MSQSAMKILVLPKYKIVFLKIEYPMTHKDFLYLLNTRPNMVFNKFSVTYDYTYIIIGCLNMLQLCDVILQVAVIYTFTKLPLWVPVYMEEQNTPFS